MLVVRFLLSWVVFFMLMRLVTWPLAHLNKRKKDNDFIKKKGGRFRATPLKECCSCSLRLPEEQGAFFGESFFCSESCRRHYYS